jgi:hypothetical protein
MEKGGGENVILFTYQALANKALEGSNFFKRRE